MKLCLGTARLGIRIILATAWFDLCVVMPCNLASTYASGTTGVTVSDLDRYTISHVPPRSPLLWAHAASVVLKTCVVLALLERFSAWVQAQQLRALRAGLALSLPSARTVLVDNVPNGEDVGTEMEGWYGVGSVEVVTPVVQDAVLAPLGSERASLEAKLAHLRAVVAKGGARPLARPGGRLMAAAGLLGVGSRGNAVDALDWTSELAAELDARLGAAKRAVMARPPDAARAAGLLRRAAFVTFRDARTASVAGQVDHAADSATWRVTHAVEPGNVVARRANRDAIQRSFSSISRARLLRCSVPSQWANVGRYTGVQVIVLKTVSWGIALLLCFIYIIPTAFIQSIRFIANVTHAVPWLKPILEDPATRSLVEGVLPPVLLFVITWVWPLLLRVLTVWQGATTQMEGARRAPKL